jgi:hypothetical protein
VRLSPSPFACLFLLASVTSAQAPTEPAAPTPKAVVLGQVSGCSLKLDPDPPVTSGGATIYTYDLKGCDKPTAIRSLTLNVNTAFPVTPDTSSQASMIVAINAGGTVEITFPSPVKADYKFSIAAQTNLSIASPTTSPFTLDMVDGTSSKGSIKVPAFSTPDQITGLSPIASDQSTVDVLVGVGAHVTFKSYEDYNLPTNSVLVATGVGQSIPEILFGAGFTTGASRIAMCHGCTGRLIGRHLLPDSIFVNTQIPTGSSSSAGSIDGFTFGMGYKIQKFVEILVGFSLAQYNEPSPGFRNAAIAAIKANANLPTAMQVPLYLQYSIPDIQAKVPGSLDGFPTLQQEPSGSPGGQIYQGSPLLNHYRGGLFIGLAYPFSLTRLFQSH